MSDESKKHRSHLPMPNTARPTLITYDAKEDKKRGLRGKIADSKKEEFTAAIKSATGLMHQY